MTVSARVVANELIRLAKVQDRSLTPLQLLKMTYIAHGWMLGLLQRPLISNQIQAWKYGPVIPDLYHRLKGYGGGNVTSELGGLSFGVSDLDATEKHLVAQVYDIYGKMTGVQLSQLTHQPGTPWHTAWETGGQNAIISNDLIAEHYRQLADERRPTAAG